MHKGREEYEKKKHFLERGEKNTKSRNQSLKSEPERVAHLILDVNLGDKVDRLILYKGDENRLEDVAS